MNKRRSSSLFPNFYEFKKALETCIEVLKDSELEKDEDGFCNIDFFCQKLKEKDKSLSYITSSHIVELFIRDPKKRILMSKDSKVKYKNIKYVKPPELLFFGTTSNLLNKIKENGIKSTTKGYIKLFHSPAEALKYAEKFVTKDNQTVYLTIKAVKAFEEGTRFSTFKEGIYITKIIDKKYIL